MLPLCSSLTSHKGSLQEVIGWVLIGWKYYANVIGPIQCKGLANLGVTQIACAEKRFLILSRNGRVYTQAYNSDTLVPQLVQGLASRNIVKIAAHSDGHHYLALAATGEVYSWGCGDGRWLGHRDTVPLEEPKVISAFSGKQAGKHVVHIACRKHLQRSRHCRGGAAHLGPWELWPAGPQYIWSASVGACSRRWPLTGLNKRPSYLFEGSSEDEAIPMLVAGLKGLKVIDVACGSGDAQTLAVTENGKKVIDVAAGSTHCLALTEDSEVHSWRSNDQCQHFDTLRVTKPEPAALPGLDAKHIVGVTCGPAQDIEAKKEAQKEKEIDEQEANASAFHRSRTPLDKDLINTGICESSGKHCLPLVQLIQQHLSQCERMVSIVLEGPTRRRWEEVRLSL
nr:E3 ubiquitin-protein ligase HERC2-like isoform X3 [Pongo abelii]